LNHSPSPVSLIFKYMVLAAITTSHLQSSFPLPKPKLCAHWAVTLHSPSTAPGNHLLLPGSVNLTVFVLPNLPISLSIMSSWLLHAVACVRISFRLKADHCLVVCIIDHSVFIHPSTGQLGCFHLLLWVWMCEYLFRFLLWCFWVHDQKWNFWIIWQLYCFP
jgi:hypothetical protein